MRNRVCFIAVVTLVSNLSGCGLSFGGGGNRQGNGEAWREFRRCLDEPPSDGSQYGRASSYLDSLEPQQRLALARAHLWDADLTVSFLMGDALIELGKEDEAVPALALGMIGARPESYARPRAMRLGYKWAHAEHDEARLIRLTVKINRYLLDHRETFSGDVRQNADRIVTETTGESTIEDAARRNLELESELQKVKTPQ